MCLDARKEKQVSMSVGNRKNRMNIRWQLVFYDLLILLFVDFVILVMYKGSGNLTLREAMLQTLINMICIQSVRFYTNIYRQVWRYGGIETYIRLLCTDVLSFGIYLALQYILHLLYTL